MTEYPLTFCAAAFQEIGSVPPDRPVQPISVAGSNVSHVGVPENPEVNEGLLKDSATHSDETVTASLEPAIVIESH